jgi:hypothetical protein
MDHTRKRIQANVKEKTIMLEHVVLAKAPHLIRANSLPLWLGLLERIQNNRPSYNNKDQYS